MPLVKPELGARPIREVGNATDLANAIKPRPGNVRT